MDYVPDRGDVIWITMDPQAGHEQAGRRPALVLSRSMYNRPSSLAVVCPITSRAKSYPFEVTIPSRVGVKGVVLADQIKNLDWKARKAEFICKMTEGVLDEVGQKVLPLIFEE